MIIYEKVSELRSFSPISIWPLPNHHRFSIPWNEICFFTTIISFKNWRENFLVRNIRTRIIKCKFD